MRPPPRPAPRKPKPTSKRPKPRGLQQQAAAHRSEAATSRDHLNEQWDRAEKLDPATPTDETPAPRTKSRRPFNRLRSSPQPAFIPTAIDFAASPVDDGSG